MGSRIAAAILDALARHEYPGKYRLFRLLRDAGLLRSDLAVRLGDVSVHAPADEWQFWGLRDAARYDPDVTTLCAFANAQLGEFDLLDLGADIGMVSRLVHAHCPGLRSVTAAEPNPSSFAYLARNLAVLPVPARALNLAVSDFTGEARLDFDHTRRSDHAGHIRTGETGGTMVRVARVDDLLAPELAPQQSSRVVRDLLIKVDVEGEERAVLHGARRTLQRARRVVIFLEVHPEVIRRTGVPAEALFEAAEAIRPCQWFLSEDPRTPPVDRHRPFFEQVSPHRQHDVIGLMEPRGKGED